MTRRIVRTIIQFIIVFIFAFSVIYFLDSQFRVLPTSIHNHLPTHHPGLVITDLTVTTCSYVSLFTQCKLDPKIWHRIDKDLYLGSGWVSRAYVHIKGKKEEDLLPEDRVIIDIKIGRLHPIIAEKDEEDVKWESRSMGVWLKHSARRHASDSQQAVTAVDVLFGADAVDPRVEWQLVGTALLLNTRGEEQEARLTIRRGKNVDIPKPIPKINDHGKFKIMQVADLHLSTGTGKCRDVLPETASGCEADPRTLEFMEKLLDTDKPDLVVLSGDQINGETAPDTQSAIFKYAAPLIDRKIPFATIFGNHDDEGTLNREAQMTLIESLPFSLSVAGPPNVDGTGNYYVEVQAHGSKYSALTIYLLDTHAYSPDERKYKGYDWLKKSQIDWFQATAKDLKRSHEGYSHIHMDLAFIHIPLPEFHDESLPRKGAWREGVTAPTFNSGFRDALVEEGVVLVGCGHDHANEFCALSSNKKGNPALWMCYAGGAGFGGYGGYGGYQRRIRFYEVDVNEARITTWKIAESGSEVGSKVDEQVIVDGGKMQSLTDESV
ncbi:Phosphatase DCR2 [Golovinomyces cichoracearum]|uniref:Phosphatase DCR2 n=1 Tax=Golovinomyces cichoracearum TaxID=62708 RepID=A0A420HQV3_9PEZI|nr:Phosphatase DCR2 [Golovinomyces cichoracearum]